MKKTILAAILSVTAFASVADTNSSKDLSFSADVASVCGIQLENESAGELVFNGDVPADGIVVRPVTNVDGDTEVKVSNVDAGDVLAVSIKDTQGLLKGDTATLTPASPDLALYASTPLTQWGSGAPAGINTVTATVTITCGK